jgi:hypothetical protein
MDALSLNGIVKGDTTNSPVIYKSIGNDLYNSTSKISSLYDTNISLPANNQILYYLNRAYRNKTLIATTGNLTTNKFWADMSGTGSTELNLNSLTFTYSNASNRFLQYQRLHYSISATGAFLESAKMRSENIYSLLNSASGITGIWAYGGSPIYVRTNPIPIVSTGVMPSYLNINTTGIQLSNECYNRTFEINGFVSIPTNVVAGSRFTVYIYLGDNEVSQATAYCQSGNRDVFIGIYAVIKTTAEDVNKYIDFRIKFTFPTGFIQTPQTPGYTFAGRGGVMNFSVKSL